MNDSRTIGTAKGMLSAQPRTRRSPQRSPAARRRWLVAIGALLTLACTMAVYYTVAGQENDPAPESNVRIVAARTDDGRVEFALQQQQADGSWSERQLPERRFFPTTATTGEWLESSALTVSTSDDEVLVRIVAARTDDGRVEFALQQQQADGSWSERQLPERRFFPTTATTGEWLESSAVPLPPVEAVNSGQQEQQDPSPAPPSPLPPSTNPVSGSQGKSTGNPPPTTTTIEPPPTTTAPGEQCETTNGNTVCTRPLTPEEWDQLSPTTTTAPDPLSPTTTTAPNPPPTTTTAVPPPPPPPTTTTTPAPPPPPPPTTTTTLGDEWECETTGDFTVCTRPLTPEEWQLLRPR